MPSLLIVLCVLCETPSASVLSKSAVQKLCCVLCYLFFLFSPHFVVQFKPSVGVSGSRLSVGRCTQMRLPPCPPEPSGGSQRGNNDRKRTEKHQQELLSYRFCVVSWAPFCLSFYSRGEASQPCRGAVQESLGAGPWEWQGMLTPGLALCLCRL